MGILSAHTFNLLAVSQVASIVAEVFVATNGFVVNLCVQRLSKHKPSSRQCYPQPSDPIVSVHIMHTYLSVDWVKISLVYIVRCS